MGQASRNERKTRRRKVAARQTAQRKARTNRQYLSALSSRVINAQFTLLAILQAQGGSVVVATDVAAGVMTDFAHLAFMTERQEDGSMKVTLTDNRRKPCTQCGGMGVITQDTIVGGTEHDTIEFPCEHCKDSEGFEPEPAPEGDYRKNTTAPVASDTNIPLVPREPREPARTDVTA